MAIQKVAGRGAAGAAAPAEDVRRSAVTWPDGTCGLAGVEAEAAHLVVLGGFALMVDDQPVQLPSGSERLLAFVALCCRAAVPRGLIAGTLWPDAPECRAHASLRSALSRLHDMGRLALDVGPGEVGLARDVSVDLHQGRQLAHRILQGPAETAWQMPPDAIEELSLDLLPGWYDDWAMLRAEDWRQLRIHALERLAEAFTAAGRYADAVAAAHAAIRADALRESSQSCLIRAHLAEGNPSEALRDFERYARRLHTELGLSPTMHLRSLVPGLRAVTFR
ncbi:BTAD domain-containing putative transcriptional regulator [Streptomyces sp. NPDC020192]|uniref:AfsR/SARP family transcriptional regulator n=1 Tax=Streptomyces sp. NPDC020192 TaxID=3365066 RepID=UPI0037BD36B2